MRNVFFLLVLANILFAVYGVYNYRENLGLGADSAQSFEDVIRTPGAINEQILERSVEQPSKTAVVETVYARVCAGPLSIEQESDASIKETKDWISEISSEDAIAKASLESVEGEKRYWVHIPPAKDFDKAKQALAKLQDKRIDSFIMGPGDDQNAISLGYFIKPEQADVLKNEIKKKGFASKVKEITQNEKKWLVLEVEESATGEWRKILVNKGFSVDGIGVCDKVLKKA